MASQTPKPALSRAPDAELHPVSGRPLPAPARSGALASPAPSGSGGGETEARGEATSKAKSLKAGKGATAADAITGPAKDKYVDLGARVPKSVRKRLRAQAKAQGVTADDLISRILDAYLP